jgi:RES domain-containing protein
MSHDHEILDILDALEPLEYSGTLWRTTWLERDPLLGGTGGGRWNPAKKFEALYTSLEENTSIAELNYHLSQAPVRSSCAMLICELQAKQLKLLDLTAEQLLIDLKLDNKMGADLILQSQKIGAVANFLGYQGIRVPSLRVQGGINCVLFSERLKRSQIVVNNKHDINWPAWIKKNK